MRETRSHGAGATRRRCAARAAAGVAWAAAALAPARAEATPAELQLGVGPSAWASTWRGDVGAGGTLRLGLRLARVVGFDFQGWQSLGTVDTRIATGLSLGVRATWPLAGVRPTARAFVIHQHEEGVASAVAEPLGVAAGIGPGIRHRAGAGGALGVEIPVRRTGERSTVTVFSQGVGTWLGGHLGPALYVGLDLGVGLDFLL